MAEVLTEYPKVIESEHGRRYLARACGAEVPGGLWHGWIEFLPEDGGTPLRSPRETTQPNRTDTRYWATGLTTVYLEGALHRALHPLRPAPVPQAGPAAYDSPAPQGALPPSSPGPDAVLNPFAVYMKGEALLRRQLGALSSWHLANIVRAYRIPVADDPDHLPPAALLDAIVADVKRRSTSLPV